MIKCFPCHCYNNSRKVYNNSHKVYNNSGHEIKKKYLLVNEFQHIIILLEETICQIEYLLSVYEVYVIRCHHGVVYPDDLSMFPLVIWFGEVK